MSGQVEGRLEAVVDGRAIGWAWNPGSPDDALEVEVLVDGETVASGVALVERPVLVDAGIGTGRYGFDVSLPEELGSEPSHTISVTAGPERAVVRPFEGFETVVRGPKWEGTTFVAEGGRSRPKPFVPEEEPAHDPGRAALVGRDGWLFLADEENLSARQLAGEPLLGRTRVEAVADAVSGLHGRLRELRIPYLLAVAPMKERVCSEFLPEGASLHPKLPVGLVNAALRRRGTAEIQNLLPALAEGRRGGPVFPLTDSNWSDRGAFFAYRDLMREAGKRVVSLEEPKLPEEARLSKRADFAGDLAGKPRLAFVDGRVEPVGDPVEEPTEEIEAIDVSDLRSMRMPAPQHLDVTPGRAPHLYEIPDAGEMPRGVLVGDSACLALIPWLAEHFSRFVFLWADEPPLEAIELEAPDVVIHVLSERRFLHGP